MQDWYLRAVADVSTTVDSAAGPTAVDVIDALARNAENKTYWC